jgi:hypothetical protein
MDSAGEFVQTTQQSLFGITVRRSHLYFNTARRIDYPDRYPVVRIWRQLDSG